MFCPRCGKEVTQGATFCGSCGQRLFSDPPQEPHRQVGGKVPPKQGQKPQRPKRTLRARWAVAGALAVVVCVVLAVGGFFYFNGGAEETVINPRVVIYDEESSPFKILASDDESVTVSSLEGIADDTILSAGVTEQTPDGLLRKIVAIELVEGGYRIETEPAALTEAIEKCDVSTFIDITPDGNYEITGQEGANNPIFETQKAYADTLDNLYKEETDDYSLSAGNRIEVELKINYGSIRMRVVNHFYAGINFTPAFEKYDLIQQKELINKTLFDKELGRPTFFVGPLPVVLVNNLKMTFEANYELRALSFAVETSIDKVFGFEYTSNEGLKVINEDNSQNPVSNFIAGGELLGASLDAALTASLGTRLYGWAGPDLSVGLDGKVSAQLMKLGEDEDAEGAITLPGIDWNLKGIFNAKLTVPISGTFILQFPANPFDKKRAPAELADKKRDPTKSADKKSDPHELMNVPLFDTGDMITLLDVSWEYGDMIALLDPSRESGAIPGTYTTRFADKYGGSLKGASYPPSFPTFSFDYPPNWHVAEENLSESGEEVTLVSDNGSEISFKYFPGAAPIPYKISGITANIEKVADSYFTVPAKLSGGSSQGPFMIGRLTYVEPKEAGSTLTVLPVSYRGVSAYNQTIFHPECAGDFSFDCRVPEEGLQGADEQEALQILQSLRVA